MNLAGPTTTLYPAEPGAVDNNNSTIAPLLGAGVFTGRWFEVAAYAQTTIIISTDQAGSLTAQFSTDGKNIDRARTTAVAATGGAIHTLARISRFFRVLYTNGSVAQGYFRMQVLHHVYQNKPLTSFSTQIVSDNNDVQLMRNVNVPKLDFARGLHTNIKTVHKFGSCTSTTGGGDVWIPYTTYPWMTTAQTVRVQAGGDANDTAAGTGARTVEVEGLDENWNLVYEVLTMAGASASAYTTNTFIRINRCYIMTTGTYTGANTGAITFENSSAVVVAYIAAGEGQTQMGLFSVPAGKTAYMSTMNVQVDSTKSSVVTLYQRLNGDTISAPFGPKRIVTRFPGITGTETLNFQSLVSFPAKTDIWAYSINGTGSGVVTVSGDVYLVDD